MEADRGGQPGHRQSPTPVPLLPGQGRDPPRASTRPSSTCLLERQDERERPRAWALRRTLPCSARWTGHLSGLDGGTHRGHGPACFFFEHHREASRRGPAPRIPGQAGPLTNSFIRDAGDRGDPHRGSSRGRSTPTPPTLAIFRRLQTWAYQWWRPPGGPRGPGPYRAGRCGILLIRRAGPSARRAAPRGPAPQFFPDNEDLAGPLGHRSDPSRPDLGRGTPRHCAASPATEV